MILIGDLFRATDGTLCAVTEVDVFGNIVKFTQVDEPPGDRCTRTLEELKAENDTVDHPPHYQGDGMEAIEAIAATGNAKGFCIGNVIKYVWRWERKGGLEDLRKAQFYLNWLISYLEKNTAIGDNQ